MASKRIKNKQILVSSNFDFNSNRIINLSEPSGSTDGATKNYVDTSILEFAAIPNEPTGFQVDDRTGSIISFSGDTFSIMPTGVSFNYYLKGLKYTNTGVTITITDVEGTHFFYFDDGNILTQTTTFSVDIIYTKAYVAELYWSVVEQKVIHIGDERHGLVMDARTHSYLHLKFGTTYITGLGLGDFAVNQNGDDDEDAQFSVSNGEIWDEDIRHLTVESPQTISPILEPPVYYRSGTTWNVYTGGTFTTGQTTFSVINYDFTGTTRLAYNLNTSGDWSLVEVPSGDYILSHIFASNDPYTPIIAIMGQSYYTTKGLARTGANVEMGNLITDGLPTQEFVPIASVIYQTNLTMSNTVHARIITTDLGDNYVNWLGQPLSPSSTPSDHGSLGGLSDDDHFQYALLSGRGGETLTIETVDGLADPTLATSAVNLQYFEGNTVSSQSGGTFNGTVNILGDLYISGTTTTVNSENMNISDNIIVINSGETSSGVTLGQAGIKVDRGSSDPYAFFFVEGTETFRVGKVTGITENTYDITYTQAVATREDNPVTGGIPYWNNSLSRLDTYAGIYSNSSHDLYLGTNSNKLLSFSLYVEDGGVTTYLQMIDDGLTINSTDTTNTLNINLSPTSSTISNNYASFGGLKYGDDYSGNYAGYSLVDYTWVTTAFLTDGIGTTANGTTMNLGGTIVSGVTSVISCDTANNFNTSFTLGDYGSDQPAMKYEINGVGVADPELQMLLYSTADGEETYFQLFSKERKDQGATERNYIELVAGAGSASMTFSIGNGDFKILDYRTIKKGLEYDSTQSNIAHYTDYSLTNKLYVDSLNTFTFQNLSGITGDTILNFQCPLKYRITSIIAEETVSFNAGNISIGLSVSTNEIVNSETVNADDVIDLPLGQKFFSLVSDTDIYISSTAFGSGQITLYFKFEKVVE